jgi:cholinesterase
VIGGDSAGAASVSYFQTAFGGRDDHLFVGSAAESISFATELNVPQTQYMYDNLAIRVGCANASDSLECLRGVSAAALQTVNHNFAFPMGSNPPIYMWQPVLDNDLLVDFQYRLYAEGKFIKVPTIAGDDTNGGATFAPRNTSTLAESNQFMRDNFPFLTLADFHELDQRYPDTGERFPGAGAFYRQASNIYGDLRYTCSSLAVSRAYATFGQKSWNYRYNVLDPADEASGLGVPHTVEVSPVRMIDVSFILNRNR